MRGIKFGIIAPLGETPRGLVEFVQRCEEAGFDSFWADDHLVFVTKAVALEVWSIIAAASLQTERIQMGAITDPHRLHPAVLAQRLATIDHLSGGRVFLGLGAGESMNLDPYGIRWDKPLSRMVEAIRGMRTLGESEEPVDYQGQFFRLSGAFIGIKPAHDGKWLPIYMASNRPRSRRFAGQLGDGWIPAPMPPSLYARFLRDLEEGAREVGRSLDGFDRAMYTHIALARDFDRAYRAVEPITHALIWPDLAEEAGYHLNLPEEYRHLHYTRIVPTDEEAKRRFQELRRFFPMELVLDFIIVGTPQDCIRRIEEYIESGVQHFVFHDFSPDPEEGFRMLTQQVIPYFRE